MLVLDSVIVAFLRVMKDMYPSKSEESSVSFAKATYNDGVTNLA